MRVRKKRMLAACFGLFLFCISVFVPAFPWAARLQYWAKRVAARFDSKIAGWRGQLGPVSIHGKLIGGGAFAQSLKGAQVIALESTSGYAALSDSQGRFTLPHLVWYPGATYTIFITTDPYHARRFKILAPSAYPKDSVIEAGELLFDYGIDISTNEGLVRFLKYDAENREYYKELYEKLAGSSLTDHQIIYTLCKYISTRHSSVGDPWGFESARHIIEKGAPHCSNLAYAMAAVAAAGGYLVRTVHTSDSPEYRNTHVAVEAYYADGWHLYDPTYGVFFLNESGVVASYRELRLNPSLMTTAAFEQLNPETARAALGWMPSVYGSGLHQLYHVGELEFISACPALN